MRCTCRADIHFVQLTALVKILKYFHARWWRPLLSKYLNAPPHCSTLSPEVPCTSYYFGGKKINLWHSRGLEIQFSTYSNRISVHALKKICFENLTSLHNYTTKNLKCGMRLNQQSSPYLFLSAFLFFWL